ncbi:DUF3761 domain-containing protein [Parafrigoribacterium soli]|uniref:DUF3761 domain-containing protein n=1 Tax=Parafrigoribacterium soli TaxID=3144663 RepID=UPI0032EEE067
MGALSVGVAFAILLGASAAFGAAHPVKVAPADVTAGISASPTHTTAPTRTPKPTPTPVVTTELIAETAAVPFESTTVDSASLAAGTSAITTVGVEGVETKNYLVTYADGVETNRVLQSDSVTTPPVAQVTTVGTYVAPPPPPPPATCTNGTYVNSAGNTVCRPMSATNAPSGATAKCKDGTYSFSQSRRGTCSSHGGVAAWL